jgi:hypothetical protein
MKNLFFKSAIKLLPALFLILGAYYSPHVMGTEHESACKDHVQNKIAWDYSSPYNSASKWEDANLERLCKGTKNAKEPGECFQKVMTGHVKWGSSDKWEWKNAIALCAGSSKADDTIDCFKGRINSGAKWDEAILQCQSSGKIVIR